MRRSSSGFSAMQGIGAEFLNEHGNASIIELVRMHTQFESQCEIHIEQQEMITRQLMWRQQLSGLNVPKFFPPSESGSDSPVEQTPGFDEYRRRHAVASAMNQSGLPVTKRRFVISATDDEINEIEDLEEKIQRERAWMSAVEQALFDCVPRNGSEAIAKLKFLTNLMVDGGEVEQDYFAYLVAECTLALEFEIMSPIASKSCNGAAVIGTC